LKAKEGTKYRTCSNDFRNNDNCNHFLFIRVILREYEKECQVVLIIGTYIFNLGNMNKISFLRLYNNYIEDKAFDNLGGQSKVSLNYNQIQGVSIQKK